MGISFQSMAQPKYNLDQMKREKLGRGVVAVRKNNENKQSSYFKKDLLRRYFIHNQHMFLHSKTIN